ncbi:MMPL family transporter [Nocardioides piscis]|uniref:MMPL family transporter n=1 Tax=Nocardioides piscis TaxID=2714938 RepID=A0A6G7YE11_9ACTN|nr:MMPL family transporter [Nocardioides piscis]QIK74881.1 MMPL family transporter [Nocardioides piscis]
MAQDTQAPDTRSRPQARISPALGRRTAWLVALLPLLLAGALIGGLGEGERDRSPLDQLPAGFDSTLGAELRDQLPDEGSSAAVVLWTSDEGDLGQDVVADLGRQAGSLGAVPSGPAGPVTLSEDGTAAIAVVPIESTSATQNADLVTELRAQLSEDEPSGLTSQVTGPAAIQADLAAVFQGADTDLLLVTAGVVALLLLLTYRSPVLWLIPLTVVGVADRLAAVVATQVLALLDVAWDESTVGILSVLVFGAGTNYALLLISRYRDELKVHESRHVAMSIAVRRTAEPVLASATTVVLGLLTLLLSVVPATRGLGLACAIGIVVAAAFVLVVLPAALVLFGRWVFWPRAPRVGEPGLVDTNSSWHRIGTLVARRPVAFVTGTLVVLAVMASGVLRIDTGLDQADQFLDRPEAIAAADRLGESFPAGVSDPAQVMTRAPADDVLAAVADVPGVQRSAVSSQGAGVTQIDVVLGAAAGTDESRDAVLALRESLEPFADTHVTGTEAESLDEADSAARDRLLILPLILALVLASLLVLLRAVVAPLLLVATVLATYAASMGISWWVFTRLLDFEGLDNGVPLLAFLFLVALGVDYNIFLVTRAREEAREHGSRVGMLRALSATGGVITSAGILLAAVFAVLGVLPLVVLAQLGTVICIGVLLDTLVVRTVLVPALAFWLGDRFWWPRRVIG